VTTASESALAAVSTCLDRIARLNDTLNAMITVDTAAALRDAALADAAAKAGRRLGLLHGLPLVIKDNIETQGIRTTSGSRFFADYVPNRDAPVVERLRRAGAIILGKSTLHEFAFGIRSTNSIVGQCHNPWHPGRVPGGSSGGSAVAVAAGMALAALGTDTGGSIRLPAAMNGIAGLRPTWGRVPNTGCMPVSAAHDTIGPMAHDVRDLALILAVIAGPDGDDSTCVEGPLGNFLPRLDDGIRGLVIGIPRGFYFDGVEPAVGAAVIAAARVLEAKGARLVEVDLEGAADMHAFMTVMVTADACHVHAERLAEGREYFDGPTYDRMLTGLKHSGLDYARATVAKRRWKATLARCFGEVDLLLSPTVPTLVPPIADGRDLGAATGAATRNTYAGAFGELPGLSLPCGLTSDGLPIGLQLEAAWWQEPRLLQAGVAYQSATDWHLARPPLDLDEDEDL
jgi:aspartyl-tRNA(Asn)/glutamyl-tRNA(Gln) amidotransferase subunit A